MPSGIDFSRIPWAQNVYQSQSRHDQRRLAVMKFASENELYEWEMDHLTHNHEWGRATNSIDTCVAKMWRVLQDRSLSNDEKEVFVNEVNEYLTNSGEYAGWEEIRPNRIGTLEEDLKVLGFGGDDYDMRLIRFTRLLYMILDSPESLLTVEAERKLLNVLLFVHGNAHHTILASREDITDTIYGATWDARSPIQEYFEGCDWAGIIVSRTLFPGPGELIIKGKINKKYGKGDVEETENHVLMSETSRYLKNQLITSGRYRDFLAQDPDDARFNNDDFNDWLKQILQGILARGFNEYNSNTYSGFSVYALANLADYAQDISVRQAARIILDFVSARFATQSYDLKRYVGLCRKPDHKRDGDAHLNLWWDPMAAWFAVLIGNYAGLQETYDGIWDSGWRRNFMIVAASSDYTVPELILDLAIDKGHNPYEIRVNHSPPSGAHIQTAPAPFARQPHSANIEILTARAGYLLTAGGHFSSTNYWWRNLIQDGIEEHHGWARPTTLLTRGEQRLDDFIHSLGSDEPIERNNTGVVHNVAVSVSDFHIPTRFQHLVDGGDYGWQFLHLREEGIYIAVNNRMNLLEVTLDTDHGGTRSYRSFKRNVERQNRDSGHDVYRTSEGTRIEFEADTEIGTWPIKEVDGEAIERNYHLWPFIESIEGPGLNRVFWADGDGLAIVNNPHYRQSLILSLTDWRHPIRIEQDCPATNLLRGGGIRCAASSNRADARNAFDGKRETYWQADGSDDEASLTFDLIDPKQFKFISIRLFDGHAVEQVVVETSNNGTDYALCENRELLLFGQRRSKGTDIEIGARTARYVRVRLISNDDPIRVSNTEIYEYRQPRHYVPDRYEGNNHWRRAALLRPGAHHDATIHWEQDPVDWYVVSMLDNNTIRATIEYDRDLMDGDLKLELFGWVDTQTVQPVRLRAIDERNEDGDYITLQATRGRGERQPETYIKVTPETGSRPIGNYSLTIQTRGREIPFHGENPPPYLAPIPEPQRLSPTNIAPVIKRRTIHTGGDWLAGDHIQGDHIQNDIDTFVVAVPKGRRLQITLDSINPDEGQFYVTPLTWGAVYGRPEFAHDWEEDRFELQERHRYTVKPYFGCGTSSREIMFDVSGMHDGGYRSDTGEYELKVELLSENFNLIGMDYFCNLVSNLGTDLRASYHADELRPLLKEGVYFDIDLEAPLPQPGDPFVMTVISRKTNRVLHKYQCESSQFGGSFEKFATALEDFNKMRPGFLG